MDKNTDFCQISIDTKPVFPKIKKKNQKNKYKFEIIEFYIKIGKKVIYIFFIKHIKFF